jgi:hypothetical protein
MAVASLVACIVLAITSVGIVFYSMTFFYVPSPPNPETGEPDIIFRPRWRAIFVTVALGGLMACATFVFFATVFLPASQIEEAEEMTRHTFAEKVGRQPIRLEFRVRVSPNA